MLMLSRIKIDILSISQCRKHTRRFPVHLLSNGDAAAFCFPAGRVPCGKRCADGLFFRFFVIVVVFFVRPPDQIINERYGGERQTDGSEDQTADAEGGRAFFAVFHFHSRKHTQCLPVHILSDSIRSI